MCFQKYPFETITFCLFLHPPSFSLSYKRWKMYSTCNNHFKRHIRSKRNNYQIVIFTTTHSRDIADAYFKALDHLASATPTYPIHYKLSTLFSSKGVIEDMMRPRCLAINETLTHIFNHCTKLEIHTSFLWKEALFLRG